MWNPFKKKINDDELEKHVNSSIKSIDYPAKIILAWAKAIEGHQDLLKWLNENGYEELVMATYAIKLKQEAREWLTQNGYAHLMAFINAAEGNEKALKWLYAHQFHLLYYMALAIEDDQEAWKWLKTKSTQDIFLLTITIKRIKDQIEENHNDVHSFGKDL